MDWDKTCQLPHLAPGLPWVVIPSCFPCPGHCLSSFLAKPSYWFEGRSRCEHPSCVLAGRRLREHRYHRVHQRRIPSQPELLLWWNRVSLSFCFCRSSHLEDYPFDAEYWGWISWWHYRGDSLSSLKCDYLHSRPILAKLIWDHSELRPAVDQNRGAVLDMYFCMCN